MGRWEYSYAKSFRKHAEFHNFSDSRIVGITLSIDNLQYDFISVYMPYQCDENYDLYMQCISKLSTLIEESCTNNIVILGDFSATRNSVFEGELLEMCSTFVLVQITAHLVEHQGNSPMLVMHMEPHLGKTT